MRLDRRKFERWLKAKRPAEIVGHNRDCHSCPIANFYSDTGGGEIVIFDTGDRYVIDRGYMRTRAPSWAAQFIFEVDGDHDGLGKISAGRALEALAECV